MKVERDKLCNKEICNRLIIIIKGYLISKNLQSRFRQKKLIVIRGATGDVYLQFALLESFIDACRIDDYQIISDTACSNQLGGFFGYHNIHYIKSIDLDKLEAYQLFIGNTDDTLIIPFRWTDSYTINHCRVRMLERFTFLDSYSYFGFNSPAPLMYAKPRWNNYLGTYKYEEGVRFFLERRGAIKGKTVIISPDANSVSSLPIWFWNNIISVLKHRGYMVFMNCNYDTYFRAPNLFLSYGDLDTALNYCGFFLGIRSGVCDIISSINCRKIILYPQKQKKVDYSVHRCEKEFSSLSLMGLCNDENLFEIDTLLIKNVKDMNYDISGIVCYLNEFELLQKKILKLMP